MTCMTDSTGRRTGKTFRAVMACLHAASSGRVAVLISSGRAESEVAYRMTRNILDAARIDYGRKSDRLVVHEGAVYFVEKSYDSDKFAGIKIVPIVDGDY